MPDKFETWRAQVLDRMQQIYRERVRDVALEKRSAVAGMPDASPSAADFEWAKELLHGIGALTDGQLEALRATVCQEISFRQTAEVEEFFLDARMPDWFRKNKDCNIQMSAAQLALYTGTQKSFLPRSPMQHPIGFLSAVTNKPWFVNDTFVQRVATMKEYFDRRQCIRHEVFQGHNIRGVLQVELGLHKRINSRWRQECPASVWSDQHYRTCYNRRATEGIQAFLLMQELILNIVLVRSTLSTTVRVALRDGQFPWLRTDGGLGSIELGALDQFFLCAGGDIFGTYVNPQRSRAKAPLEGYLLLAKELELFAAVVSAAAHALLHTRNVDDCLKELRSVSGFRGTGFRAKEILMDIFSVADLWAEPGSIRDELMKQYGEIVVLGVGPVRTMNFLMNLPFRQGSDMAVDEMERMYIPWFRFTLEYMRATFEEYRHRAYLCVLYEWCEYQKALQVAYCNAGRNYSPANYEADGLEAKRVRVSPEMLAQHRQISRDLSTALAEAENEDGDQDD